jgi:PEP-CTERM motif
MRASKRWMAALALLGACWSAQAATVTGQLQQQDVDTWQANFLVTNTDIAPDLSEITFFFEPAYTQLNPVAAPSGWTWVTAQPDLSLGSGGFVDALAENGPGLSQGQHGLFSVQFDWNPSNTPVPVVTYEVRDPTSFAVLESGSIVSSVPEPSTWALMAAGSLLLIGAARRRRPI